MTTTIELIAEAERMAAAVRVHSLQFGGTMCALFTNLAQRLRELDKPDCVWTYDMDQSMYDTSCGEAWRFDEGFLKDHSIKFCPFCAGQVKEST